MGTHLGAAAPNFMMYGRVGADGTLPLSWEDIMFSNWTRIRREYEVIHKIEWYRVRHAESVFRL
ncbi:UNVERIFIED_CONTAM: hypothetical protein C7383_101255 [Murimonas intestini]|uniref:Uncharacterized protein n=1 Tax=Murimonas intestini TaxID=1337051 RepID=A0AB73T9G4_9FIRM